MFNFNTQGDNTELFGLIGLYVTDKELEDIVKDYVDSPADIDECIRQYRKWAQAQ